jgi:hypothetical protein
LLRLKHDEIRDLIEATGDAVELTDISLSDDKLELIDVDRLNDYIARQRVLREKLVYLRGNQWPLSWTGAQS